MKWIDVENELPETDEYFLVTVPRMGEHGETKVLCARLSCDDWYSDFPYDQPVEPTHWMRFPKPAVNLSSKFNKLIKELSIFIDGDNLLFDNIDDFLLFIDYYKDLINVSLTADAKDVPGYIYRGALFIPEQSKEYVFYTKIENGGKLQYSQSKKT